MEEKIVKNDVNIIKKEKAKIDDNSLKKDAKKDSSTTIVENAVKKELPLEQSILMIASLNASVNKKIEALSKRENIKLIYLEPKIISDYFEMTGQINQTQERKTLEEFLSSASNRSEAKKNALKLWNILTSHLDVKIENSESVTFSETQVVQATNLSHKQAKELFALLRAFGFLTFVNGSHEFTLNFRINDCLGNMETEVLAMAKVLSTDILKCKKFMENNPENFKEEDWSNFKNKIHNILDI